MSSGNFSIEYAERLYSALLSLYPFRFRVRFAPEMIQLFRDSYQDALEKGQVAVFVALWLQVTRDLFVSVVRERSRELLHPLDLNHPLIAVIDLLLIPGMVTAKLLALGPILTLLVHGGRNIPANQFALTSGFFSIAIGALAILVSVIITKLRPTVRLWVKLST
jgi:hypothetical protein